MFIKKNEYYIYIQSLRSINLNFIKIKDKFNIIYRNDIKKEKKDNIIKYIKLCKKKNIKFYVMNDIAISQKFGADGVYLSSYNRKVFRKNNEKGKKFEIIGSAHNLREINIKRKQGCKKIILSRLFRTNYDNKKSFYGITKFNLITKNNNNYFVALGGIRSKNLMKLKMLNCPAIALLSEAKKKPAIIRRLF
tara:strand:+ start:11384 stop:11959 length:576 start_codon:yes stop_codon:yes gene_type:complete